MATAAMDEIADEVAGRGVASVFLYTREAHPGERYPHHDSFERKVAHARAFRDIDGCRRPILIDDLAGTCHRAYGMLPNMTWVVLKRGKIAYKADWTEPDDIRSALQRLLDVPEERATARLPFSSERMAFRSFDHDAFRKGLERNGPKAVRDFYGEG